MRERQPCVYILASGFNGTLYIGVNSDLIGRLMQRRADTFSGFPDRHDVERLVWYDAANTMEAAIAAEDRIKTSPRDYKQNLVKQDNPCWNGLAMKTGQGTPLKEHVLSLEQDGGRLLSAGGGLGDIPRRLNVRAGGDDAADRLEGLVPRLLLMFLLARYSLYRVQKATSTANNLGQDLKLFLASENARGNWII